MTQKLVTATNAKISEFLICAEAMCLILYNLHDRNL